MSAKVMSPKVGRAGGGRRWLVAEYESESLGLPGLPGTVAAAHLESCAAELAGNAAVGTTGELADVLEHLVAGQQLISVALSRLACRVRGSSLAGVPSEDLHALIEVLEAASAAAGYSAEALAESEPVLGILLQTADEDTRL